MRVQASAAATVSWPAMTMVTSSSRISPSARPLSSSSPRRSSPWWGVPPARALRARRSAMIAAAPASRRRRGGAQPEVGPGRGPLGAGEDRAAEPHHQVGGLARGRQQVVGLVGQVGAEERAADRVEADGVGQGGDVDDRAVGDRVGVRSAQSRSDGGAGGRGHLVAHRLQPLVVEGGCGEPSVVDPARLGRGEQAGTGDARQGGVLDGVLAPAARRGLEHVPDVGRVVEQQRRRARAPGRRRCRRSARDTSPRNVSGSARIERKARAMSHDVGSRHADVGRLHRLQAGRDAHPSASSSTGLRSRRRPSHVHAMQVAQHEPEAEHQVLDRRVEQAAVAEDRDPPAADDRVTGVAHDAAAGEPAVGEELEEHDDRVGGPPVAGRGQPRADDPAVQHDGHRHAQEGDGGVGHVRLTSRPRGSAEPRVVRRAGPRARPRASAPTRPG